MTCVIVSIQIPQEVLSAYRTEERLHKNIEYALRHALGIPSRVTGVNKSDYVPIKSTEAYPDNCRKVY